ncbi:hypothetical protein TALC_00979 [Thermoplasmatales archaeon BRNA1]|nr:hypothetical protein TALC_00979 [Thermoplasmatales archaeon BRNA1]
MNRRGITGVVDAVAFIVLIGLAAALLGNALADESGSADDVVPPSEVCSSVFQSRVRACDIGMNLDDPVMHPFPMLAAASIRTGDGAASAYLKGILDTVYPWKGAYFLKMSFREVEETTGTDKGPGDLSFRSQYSAGFGGVVNVVLEVYL